jgi:hypothetical protein
MDLTDRLLGDESRAEAPARWAASGAMWLTGRAGGPPLSGPGALALGLDTLAGTLATLTSRAGQRVDVDGPALLGERAALSGFARRGDVSCGGATRLLRAVDGWIAVSLARADDVELVPAWLGVDVEPDPWPAIAAGGQPWPSIAAAVASRTAIDLVATGTELGLAVARLGERRGDTDAVRVARLGTAPPLSRLEAVRVVDLSALWAGPLCGQLLAAAGLDVVKVESVRRPDGARHGPAAFFDLLNAGKASVALDLAALDGRSTLHRLLGSAHVVIEGSRPRALEQLGVDVVELATTSALRIWVSITGHGRGPADRDRVGFGDDTAVAGGLVAHDTGPVFCADAAADPATGLLAACAVVDRLLAGERWLLDVALARTAARLAGGPCLPWGGAVAKPRARPLAGRAPELGRDTSRILGEL